MEAPFPPAHACCWPGAGGRKGRWGVRWVSLGLHLSLLWLRLLCYLRYLPIQGLESWEEGDGRRQGGPCSIHRLLMPCLRALWAWPGFRQPLIRIMHEFFRGPCPSQELCIWSSLDRKMHLFSAPPQPQAHSAEGPFPHGSLRAWLSQVSGAHGWRFSTRNEHYSWLPQHPCSVGFPHSSHLTLLHLQTVSYCLLSGHTAIFLQHWVKSLWMDCIICRTLNPSTYRGIRAHPTLLVGM